MPAPAREFKRRDARLPKTVGANPSQVAVVPGQGTSVDQVPVAGLPSISRAVRIWCECVEGGRKTAAFQTEQLPNIAGLVRGWRTAMHNVKGPPNRTALSNVSARVCTHGKDHSFGLLSRSSLIRASISFDMVRKSRSSLPRYLSLYLLISASISFRESEVLTES